MKDLADMNGGRLEAVVSKIGSKVNEKHVHVVRGKVHRYIATFFCNLDCRRGCREWIGEPKVGGTDRVQVRASGQWRQLDAIDQDKRSQ